MKKSILIASIIIATSAFSQTRPIKSGLVTTNKVTVESNLKIEQDKNAIKAMAGIYKVSFDFAETFAPDTAYKFQKRYHDEGLEYVFIVEENDKKISLQHLLIINDSVVIKHWRQDWEYENSELYNYYKNDEWIKKSITAEQAKGTWTQKVFQVDDSPRYESYGTWMHVDGKHFWEGVTDAPLPRREFTKRNDYNVMRRHSRIELNNDGWDLIQDNEKIVRNGGVDKLLCWEKGVEKFTKGNYNAVPTLKYWEKQKNYWMDVRKVWDDLYRQQPNLKLTTKIDNQKLYEKLFELGFKSCKEQNYLQGTSIIEIKTIIESFVKQS